MRKALLPKQCDNFDSFWVMVYGIETGRAGEYEDVL